MKRMTVDGDETTALEPRIVCGWCGSATGSDICEKCGRNPVTAWLHRGLEAPQVAAGRPTLDADEIRSLYTEARERVTAAGKPPTVEAIAEALDRSPRTVRAWRQRFSLE